MCAEGGEGESNCSRNGSFGSGSFRIQFNPGLLRKGWGKGGGWGEKESNLREKASVYGVKKRNKNKVKCLN